ncbi:MAG: hypothetical protein M1840_005180 [Geoglossum simile]|nr:MAG: hypothetical protein M1840_005180 [Geoglossum simile]
MTTMTSAGVVPPRCYKPFLTRAPALTLFVFLNLLLISLVEIAFRKLPPAPGHPLMREAPNSTTDSAVLTSLATSSTSTPSTLLLGKRIPPTTTDTIPLITTDTIPPTTTDTIPTVTTGPCTQETPCPLEEGVQTASTPSTRPSLAVTTLSGGLSLFPPKTLKSGGFAPFSPCRAGNPPRWCYSSLIDRDEPGGALGVSPLGVRALGITRSEFDVYPLCVGHDGREYPLAECSQPSNLPAGTPQPTPTAASVPDYSALDATPPHERAGPCWSVNPRSWCTVYRRQAASVEPSPLPRMYSYWTIPNGTYFLGNYVPIITAVFFNVLWTVAAASIKAMEPFYQLAGPRGATGARSLNLKPTSSGVGLVACHAVSQGHWVVFWSSAISLSLAVLVPLSSEMVTIDTHDSCVVVSRRVTHCFGKLRISPIIGRAVQALLGLMAVMTISLTALMWGRWSGVFADPWSCSGLASLFQSEELVEEFRRLDPDSSNEELAKAIAQNRYQLGYYHNPRGSDGYGLTKYKEKGQRGREPQNRGWGEMSIVRNLTNKVEKNSLSNGKTRARGSLWLHPALLIAFALGLVGILILVLYYGLRAEDTGFERFMDSDGFGVSFLMTAIGMAIKCYWTKIEEETRAVEPYRNLSAGNAQPRDSILVCAVSNPITSLVVAVTRARPHLAVLVFNTLLSEVLIVSLSRIPFRGDSIYIAYVASSRLVTAIIPFMLVTLIWVGLRRRLTVDLPRRPDTIAAVLSYLCGSSMLQDFQGLSTVDGQTRDGVVVKMGKRYKLGKIVGVDGVERVGIDEHDLQVQG